jgi:hypothetical protein
LLVEPEVDEGLVRDVARVVVARVAPAELLTFGVVSEAYLAGSRPRSGSGGGDGPLSFGAGDAVVLVTPVALMVANEVTRHLFDELVRDAVGRGRAAMTRAVRRLFRIDGERADAAEEDPPVKLTASQWVKVRQIVVDAARRGGLPEETAELVGDAVVGAGQAAGECDT